MELQAEFIPFLAMGSIRTILFPTKPSGIGDLGHPQASEHPLEGSADSRSICTAGNNWFSSEDSAVKAENRAGTEGVIGKTS